MRAIMARKIMASWLAGTGPLIRIDGPGGLTAAAMIVSALTAAAPGVAGQWRLEVSVNTWIPGMCQSGCERTVRTDACLGAKSGWAWEREPRCRPHRPRI